MNVFVGEKPPEARTTGTQNTTKKRVLIVGPTLGSHGGIEAFSASIARELHEHGGFDVQLVFRLRGGGDLKPDFLRALAELDFPCHVLRGIGPAIVRYIRWADLVIVISPSSTSPSRRPCSERCWCSQSKTVGALSIVSCTGWDSSPRIGSGTSQNSWPRRGKEKTCIKAALSCLRLPNCLDSRQSRSFEAAFFSLPGGCREKVSKNLSWPTTRRR